MKVIEAYFQLFQSSAIKDLTEKRITLLKKQELAAEKSILAGTGTITEKVELRAATDKANVEMISINQNILAGLNELSFLTGITVGATNTSSFKESSFKLIDEKTIDEWESRALSQNFNTNAKKDEIIAAEKLLSQKYARYPSLDLTLQMARGSVKVLL